MAGRWTKLCALGVAAGLIAGCGGGGDVTTVSSSSTATTSTPPATTANGGAGHAPAVGDGTGGVKLAKVGDFDQPVYVTQPAQGDPGHLYVVEQCGAIERVPLGGGSAQPFLDLSDLVTCGGEQGLLSVAFDPGYAQNGRLYVNYTNHDGTSITARYTRSAGDPATADPDSAEQLLAIEDFAPNHNGGLLQFGPDDRLYLGMGDGGGSGDPERTAQNPDRPLGKILRLDPSHPGGYEVAALGLRNPWRYSFDPRTRDLWIGDVGQDTLEEVDALTPGQLDAGSPPNLGWSAFEGTDRFNSDQQAPSAIPPVYEYSHDRGCSITGGYVVRDPDLTSLYGRYLYGDYCEGELHSFTARPGHRATDDRDLGLKVDQLSSFGLDASGHLYAVSTAGPVYRLDPDA